MSEELLPTIGQKEKSWASSLTIRAGALFTVLMYAEAQAWLPAGTHEGVTNIFGMLIDLVEAGLGLAALFGMRRAVGTGTALRLVPLLLAFTFVPLLVGCVHYDAGEVQRLAQRNIGAPVFSLTECHDFATASLALRDGPDSSLKYLGKGDQLERIGDRLRDHALECEEVVRRRELSQPSRTAIRTAFDGSWEHAAEAVD